MLRKTSLYIIAVSLLFMLIAIQLPILAEEADKSEESKPVASIDMNAKALAEEVDVLQTVEQLKLKPDQISFIIKSIKSLEARYAETQKQELALQNEIKKPLAALRDALLAGKPASKEDQEAAYAKLEPIIKTRLAMQNAIANTANACVDLIDEKQRKTIGRTPDVVLRAGNLLKQIRITPESSWADARNEFAKELVQVKMSDRWYEWHTQYESINNLPSAERDKRLELFNNDRNAEIAAMNTEALQLLDSVRASTEQQLTVTQNKLIDALKSQTELHQQLYNIMVGILDNKHSKAALQAKLDAMNAESDK